MLRGLHIAALFLAIAGIGRAQGAGDYEARLAHGDYQGAIAVLQLVPRDSAEFPWAIHEAAKVAYRAERWGEFFALSYYARATFPSSAAREELTLLETLGLLRHCHFRRAALVFASIDRRSLPKSRQLQMEKVAAWLELFGAAKTEDPAADSTGRPAELFQDRAYWRVRFTKRDMTRIDPWRLRREITPACRGGAR